VSGPDLRRWAPSFGLGSGFVFCAAFTLDVGRAGKVGWAIVGGLAALAFFALLLGRLMQCHCAACRAERDDDGTAP